MDAPDIKAYPFMFDPSQFANPYSQWNKQALPFMGQYAGAPTDAHGNPIQSYQTAQQAHDAWAAANPAPAQAPAKTPGVTLNSAQQLYNQMAAPSAMNPTGNPAFGASEWGFGLGAQGAVDRNSPAYQMDPSGAGTGAGGAGTGVPGTIGGGQAGAAPPAAAPQNPIDMNQAYLSALANPGKVTTPGATVAQSAPPSASSGVLQQFLQNWQNQGSPTQGAGNYNNKGFFDALQGMV